jgi:hypothetical protein
MLSLTMAVSSIMRVTSKTFGNVAVVGNMYLCDFAMLAQ